MDFGKKGLMEQLNSSQSHAKKIRTKSVLILFKLLLVAIVFSVTVTGFCLYGAVMGILDETPDMGNLDVSPKGLATTIYDASGNKIQTLIGKGANRSLITYDQLPENLINAFVAIEDSRFWTHEGIDLKGILRAGVVGLTSGRFSEGASTITQQLIKNNVFENGGQEKTTGARFVRKIQEQYLALELDHVMSKEKILENYLNTINLGANCLGVQKAAERYFNKDVSDLTLSECAVIAGITQNPYGYNPIKFPEKNAERREKVLNDMEEQGYISAQQKEEALADNVYDRIAEIDHNRSTTSTPYTYFVDRLISDVLRDLEAAGYTADQANAMLYSGGLHIYTTQDPEIQSIVDTEVNNEANYEGIQQKFAFTYRLTLKHSDGTTTSYSTSDIRQYSGMSQLEFNTRDEISALTAEYRAEMMMEGDEYSEDVDITLQPQVSVVIMDQSTGYVKAIAGGRGEKTASLSLNRATNTFRQPGSTFKVLASFAPAIDACGDTLATTFYDEPYTTMVDGSEWTPKNWYSSSKYAGYANIRQGIVYSMNILAVRCLVEDVTPELAYRYVENFGINTLIPKTDDNSRSGQHDVRATIALGGITQGVTNMQLTGAYAAIANGGTYTEPVLYTRILDNDGQVIIDNTPETHRVLQESTAFLLTDAMRDSMKDSRLFGMTISSSSDEAMPSNITAAGKSGTTTSYNDLWFVGYTPYYTMGIWSGFDDNAKFDSDDNRNFHKTMWKTIMEKITEGKAAIDFNQPDDIVTAKICNKSGKLATKACSADPRDGIVSEEYFKSGTEPTEYCDLHTSYEVCRVSGMKPGPYCQKTTYRARIKLPEETTGVTDDNNYAYSSRRTCDQCQPLITLPGLLNPDGTTNTTGGTGTGITGTTGTAGSSSMASGSGTTTESTRPSAH